jgi:ACS family D-galactonate transporter-like MFS transporter
LLWFFNLLPAVKCTCIKIAELCGKHGNLKFCGGFVGLFDNRYFPPAGCKKKLRGRIFTGVLGLVFTIPALFLLGYGSNFELVVFGAVFFCLGFGIFDANSMPILCQFVSLRYRA